MTLAAGRPLVSVVIPAYNAAAMIGDALRSVFAQTFTDFEVVVVDDGSTDDTARVVEALGAGVVRLIRQANRGPAAARNAGIAASTAPLIAFLDADDEWLPGKLELQTAYFAAHPEAALLHTATARAGDRQPEHEASRLAGEPPASVFCDLFHTDYDINTLTVMVRREAVEEAGGFDERREVHVEDWDLWLRIAARHKVGYLPVPTAVRRPGGGMSGDVEKTFRGQAAVIRKIEPICAQACSRHQQAFDACLRRRWYRFYWELGYARRRAGRRPAAAWAFLQAIARQPLAAGGWTQLAASVTGRRVAQAVRDVRTASPNPEPPSLLNHTIYRRTRRLISNHVHSADTLLHRARLGERRRILFEAASPMSFVIFRPVYERLRRDPRFEFWFTATGSAWEPTRLYEV
ncbi:MAG: glycosyltransferase family 2 protein, partial [Acidobacteria bacterium]